MQRPCWSHCLAGSTQLVGDAARQTARLGWDAGRMAGVPPCLALVRPPTRRTAPPPAAATWCRAAASRRRRWICCCCPRMRARRGRTWWRPAPLRWGAPSVAAAAPAGRSSHAPPAPSLLPPAAGRPVIFAAFLTLLRRMPTPPPCPTTLPRPAPPHSPHTARPPWCLQRHAAGSAEGG